MIILKLNEQQAWFLTQLLENVFTEEEDDQHQHLFFTNNEDDELNYDQDFKDHILEVNDLLLKARGF